MKNPKLRRDIARREPDESGHYEQELGLPLGMKIASHLINARETRVRYQNSGGVFQDGIAASLEFGVFAMECWAGSARPNDHRQLDQLADVNA
jgi:hypothetical protein